MLEKQPGVTKVSKIQTILLYEVNYIILSVNFGTKSKNQVSYQQIMGDTAMPLKGEGNV